MKNDYSCAAIALAALTAYTASARAQESGAAEAETPAQLDEVTVTVQKRVQNLQEVPASVGVIDGRTLEQTGSFDASQLEKYSPNIEIYNDPQAPVIGIRGFSTETNNVGFEPSVGLTLDDLALGRPEFIADGFFDMDRIEVLRGTQGTLFGKNTIAGVVNFHTVEPDDTFAGNLTGTFGLPSQKRGEGGFTIPLTDWLTSRISGVWWRKQGEVYNSTLNRYEDSQEQKAGRLKLNADLGDRWKVGVSAQRSHTVVLYAPWQLDDASPNAMAFARQYDSSTEDNPTDSHTTENLPGYVNRTSNLVRTIATYDQDQLWGAHDVVATAILGHASFGFGCKIDTDASAADLVNTDFSNADQQNSAEVRLAGVGDSLFGLAHSVNWVVGLYGMRAHMVSALNNYAGKDLVAFANSPAGREALSAPAISQINLAGANPSVPIDDEVLRPFTQRSTSAAVFGEMTWNLTEKLATVIGARVGRDDKAAHFNVSTVGPGIIATVVGASPFTADLTRHENDFSPKLGLQYQWTRDFNQYLVAARGYKGGGFNATADSNSNLEFEPERAFSVETGVKSEWLERSLRINAGLYRTDVSDLQVVDFQGTSFKVGNAAKARLQGIELETRWQPSWTWLTVNAAAALSRAYYLSYPNAPSAPEQSGSTQDLTGRTIQRAPRATATLSPAVNLPVPFFNEYGATFGVDLSYRGNQYSSGDLDSHSFEKAYTLLGARFVLGPADQRWGFIVNGSNLTNHRVATLVVNNPVYAHTYSAHDQAPTRSWSASFQARFF